MKRRFFRVLPTVVAAVALALCSGYPSAPVVVALVTLASALVPARAPFDRATQRLSAIVVTMLVVAGVRAADLPITGPDMRSFALGLGLAPLCIAAVRAFVKNPEGGRRMDLALALLGLLSCGSTRPGAPYVALIALFVAATVLSARAEDDERPSLSALPVRAWALGALVLTVAVVGSGAVAASAVPVGRFLEARFQRAAVDRWESRTGFSDSVRFGRVTKLTSSHVVVLRLSGAPVSHLRGVALDHYEDERWSRTEPEAMHDVSVPRERPRGPGVVELRAVRVDGERLFVPLDARELASPNGALKTDSMGAIRHLPNDRAPMLWFRTGPREGFPIAPFRGPDVQVPPSMRPQLRSLASEWTAGLTRPEDALVAIEEHLQREYSYSADYARRTAADAVMEFLFVAKRGHCEAFASAMVLLARSIDIPARLVVGYRVGERNPVFSHWVVRQSNAHAWVEAEVSDGSWKTFDPTPMNELAQDVPHDERGVDAAVETLSALWTYAETWLAERTIFELGGTAAFGLALFATIRLRRARREAGGEGDTPVRFTPPLIAFANLERLLASRGLGREHGETIEQWATRLPEAAVAAVVRRYAELRYGGGDPAAISSDLEEATRQVGAMRR